MICRALTASNRLLSLCRCSRCVPAIGYRARQQLRIIDRELERVRRSSPASPRKVAHAATSAEAEAGSDQRRESKQGSSLGMRPASAHPRSKITAANLIREPVELSPIGIVRTRPVNSPTRAELQVRAAIQGVYRSHTTLLADVKAQVASSPPRPPSALKSSFSSPSITSEWRNRPSSAPPAADLPPEGPWSDAAAPRRLLAPRPLLRGGLSTGSVAMLLLQDVDQVDDESLTWQQKRAVRARQKKAKQRAVLAETGDDPNADGADGMAWHGMALKAARNAHSATVFPAGSRPEAEPPLPMLPVFRRSPSKLTLKPEKR